MKILCVFLVLVTFATATEFAFSVISTYSGGDCNPANLIQQDVFDTPIDACFNRTCDNVNSAPGTSFDFLCVNVTQPPPQLAGRVSFFEDSCSFQNLSIATYQRLGECVFSGVTGVMITCNGTEAQFLQFCEDPQCSVNCLVTTQNINECVANSGGTSSTLILCGNQPPFSGTTEFPFATTGSDADTIKISITILAMIATFVLVV